MSNRIIKRLELERTRRLEKASRILLQSDDVKSVKEHLTWIEMASDLIESSRGNTKFIWSIIIGSICLLLAGLVTTTHLFNTQIALELETENLELRLDKTWSFMEGIRTDEFSINNLVTMDAWDLICSDPSDERCIRYLKAPTKLILKNDEIDLRRLEVAENAEIQLSAVGNNLRLIIKNSTVKGELQILQGAIDIDGEWSKVKSQSSEIPATVSFETVNAIKVPVMVEFAFPENLALSGLYINKMGFREENPPGSAKFQCYIRSGVLNLIDIAKIKELRKADCLVLKEDIDTRRMKITKNEQSIVVHWDGSVNNVHTGPEVRLRNVTPTWLEFFYYEKRLTFLWSAVAFLWGLLWSMRNTIFK